MKLSSFCESSENLFTQTHLGFNTGITTKIQLSIAVFAPILTKKMSKRIKMLCNLRLLLGIAMSSLMVSTTASGSLVVAREQDQSGGPGASQVSQTPSTSRSAPVRKIGGDNHVVHTFSFSPDSRLLATGGVDRRGGGTIRIWTTSPRGNSNQPIRTMEAATFPDYVKSVAFSPNGQILASGSITSKVIRLWNVQTGEMIRTLQGHDGISNRIAFSPNGQILASASSDKTIKLWDMQTGKALRTIQLGDSSQSLSFSPDGKLLAAPGYFDKSGTTIRIWNVETGSPVRTFPRPDSNVKSVAFSPDGKMLAAAYANKTIKLWNVQTGAVMRKLEGHTRDVHLVDFSPNGKYLVSGGYDGMVKLWDVRTGVNNGNRKVDVRDVNFSPNGEFLAFIDKNAVVILGPTQRFQ